MLSGNVAVPRAVLLACTFTVVLAGGVMSGASSAESRIEIKIPEADREHCARRMREYLAMSNEILGATLEGDHQAVADKALRVVPRRYRASAGGQAGGSGGRHERMQANMPQGYQAMMHHLHDGFKRIADLAREEAEPVLIQRQLVRTQNTCVACHATYRFTTAEE
ncbi:hypothetical protein ACN2MM_12140 [Alkalilimnicola ehrlichii MLHE-1]|uniref:Cytochrome C n=1 Tax=Alkalilimnicola ehrlichii (strain ATCC BAA-1101 / DSM 17681 / MLHE-1) TaxID=187272 RepID=Q0A6C0_ALKEH|nr:hypothetical protein [Alkalilimnicola ehrlichii]ABI57617.1 hypothetical protein Mlg_2275 [Alkalilimnicola ehrlichii MLHE-1]